MTDSPFRLRDTQQLKLEAMDAVVTSLITKVQGDMPDEMLALVATILVDERVTAIPPIHWRVSTRGRSSGRCSRNRMVVTCSPSTSETRRHNLVIHEVCHWLHRDVDMDHSPFFYEKLWELHSRYGSNMAEATAMEFEYKSYAAKIGYALWQRQEHGRKWQFKGNGTYDRI